MQKRTIASAPGKVIISGEHFVVHGSYAVAAAINKRATVTVSASEGPRTTIRSGGRVSTLVTGDASLAAVRAVTRKLLRQLDRTKTSVDITVASDIPAGSGLGSSAAVSVALGAALLQYFEQKLDNSRLFECAHVGENVVHGNPSGIDTHASILGGMIIFSRGSGAKPIPLNRSLQLLIAYSGKARKTADLVSHVAARRGKFPNSFEHLAKAASFFSLEVIEAATGGDLPYLGALMNYMQSSLYWLGVSTPSLDRLIEASITDDVYGAKITGAGGGGSIIALPKPDKANSVLSKIAARYPLSFLSTLPQEGVRIENSP